MTSNHHDHDSVTTSEGRGSCCGHAPSTEAVAPAGADDVAECPVMAGSTVIKSQAEAAGLYRDYNGQRYWLCCDGCGPLFDADPGRYAAA